MDSEFEEICNEIATSTMRLCAKAADRFGVHVRDVAHKVIVDILTGFMIVQNNDSVLLTLRTDPSDKAVDSHIHYDYLDADPDHIMQDFHLPNNHDNEKG